MTKKAFTLIELLVVIAIIALLLSILIPSLSAIKEYASIVNCLSNQRSLAMCYLMYANDNDEKFCSSYVHSNAGSNDPDPPSWVKAPLQYDASGAQVFVGNGDAGGLLLNLDARMNGFREGAIWPYLESPQTFHCPGDPRLRKGGSSNWGGNPRYYNVYRSYGMPDFYAISDGGIETSLANIKAGGQKLLFVEDQYDRRNYNIDAWSFIPYDFAYWDPLGNYHNKGCTFSFVDGHAEEYRWKDRRTMIFMGDRDEANRLGFGKGVSMPDNADFKWLNSHYPSKGRY